MLINMYFVCATLCAGVDRSSLADTMRGFWVRTLFAGAKVQQKNEICKKICKIKAKTAAKSFY